MLKVKGQGGRQVGCGLLAGGSQYWPRHCPAVCLWRVPRFLGFDGPICTADVKKLKWLRNTNGSYTADTGMYMMGDIGNRIIETMCRARWVLD